MTTTTLDYWDIDGLALNTHAWDIDPAASVLDTPPPLRGEAVTVPHRPGTLWRPRVPDGRTITLAMWVAACTPDGVEPTGRSAREAQLRGNWRTLRSALWGPPDRQLAITRRWDGGTKSATGKASFADGLEPAWFPAESATFTADLRLDDPYLYSTPVRLLDGVEDGAHAIDVAGDAASPRYTLRLDGPWTDPVVTVRRGLTALSTLTYDGTIAGGSHLEVAFPDFTVDGVPAANVRTGQPAWLVLDPSATDIAITGAGGGTVTIDHSPAWI